MQPAVNLDGQPFHFIGIGGIGMSALAYILASRGITVSGSDRRSNRVIQKLQKLDTAIFLSQEAKNLSQFQDSNQPLPQVVYSTAIKVNNPEYQAALDLGCPMLHRSDLLAALINQADQSIAVAGTHGKTTTSSLIGHLLVKADLDPTIVIGGEVATWAGNARVGTGPHLVAEADESDGSLTKFHSAFGIITNIELDHPDHYSSLEDVLDIFHTFVEHTQQVLVCLDCQNIRDRLMPKHPDHHFLTYSLDRESGADYTLSDITYSSTGSTATVHEKGQTIGTIQVPLLGHHNLSNALAAIAIGRQCGAELETLAKGLLSFGGTKRRFEVRGEANNIRLIDDYAHHPSEIEVTLASAKLTVTDPQQTIWKRVIAVFQPHRYSRIHTFLSEFSQAFKDADHVIVTDIYSAGEANQVGIDAQQVQAAIAQHHESVTLKASLDDIKQYLPQISQPGDLILFLGAGNLNSVIPDVLAAL
ncbi:MAG: UDP-N-acetylmuramate--L-alanine ligase [Cyanobacteria bacterium P01_F01_bin.3]